MAAAGIIQDRSRLPEPARGCQGGRAAIANGWPIARQNPPALSKCPTHFAACLTALFSRLSPAMSDLLAVLLLGLIEGVTEFLPVSSTGHLLLAEHWLGHRSELFNVVIQCGAVVAVLAVFTGRVRDLATGWKRPAARDYLSKLAVAFVLTAAGGIALKKLGLRLPHETTPVALATLIGGVLLIGVERWIRGRAVSEEITWTVAIAVGVGQLVAAAFPGASRSGTTILFALALGVSRPAATEFSFLLGIPTLLAAGAKEILDALKEHSVHESWGLIALGTIVSAITAFVAVKWLLRYVQSHTFEPFGWYRIVLGALILALVR
jgi:undecaprenyl-diphosphatase